MKLDGEVPVGFSGEGSSLPMLGRWDGGNNNINEMHVIERLVLKLELGAKNGSLGCERAQVRLKFERAGAKGGRRAFKPTVAVINK